jgi:CBS domain-containing membrane protein
VNVRDILDPHPVTAAPHESAGVAWERMHERGVDYVVVLDDDRVVGLLSRHDLGGPEGGRHRRMGRRVADLMQGDAVTATPQTSVGRAAMLMRRHGVGCLVVMVRHRLVGVVTVSQLLALLEKESVPE